MPTDTDTLGGFFMNTIPRGRLPTVRRCIGKNTALPDDDDYTMMRSLRVLNRPANDSGLSLSLFSHFLVSVLLYYPMPFVQERPAYIVPYVFCAIDPEAELAANYRLFQRMIVEWFVADADADVADTVRPLAAPRPVPTEVPFVPFVPRPQPVPRVPSSLNRKDNQDLKHAARDKRAAGRAHHLQQMPRVKLALCPPR